jgi:hypothetical protein
MHVNRQKGKSRAIRDGKTIVQSRIVIMRIIHEQRQRAILGKTDSNTDPRSEVLAAVVIFWDRIST